MMDLGLDGEYYGEDVATDPEALSKEESGSEKLEIPKQIIDRISDIKAENEDDSDIVEETEKTPNKVAEVQDLEKETPVAAEVKDGSQGSEESKDASS